MAASTIRRSAQSTISTISHASIDFTRAAINLPNTYANYVASNSSSISNIESSLRSLTYLLPGARLHDSELASESVHTFVQLLSIYHDHVLKHRAIQLASSPSLLNNKNLKIQLPKPTLHSKYTSFWTSNSSLYSKIATLLKIAQYTELLWEMIAKRRGGEKQRWRVVVLIESFKAICRLILMRLTNSRPLVNPPLPLREDFAPTESEVEEEFSEEKLKIINEMDTFDTQNAFGDAGVPTPPISESEKTLCINSIEPFNMPRTGLTLPNIPNPDTISSYLLAHIVTPDDVKPAKQLLHRLTSLQGQAAEVLYIIRPLIYALLLQRIARSYGYEGSKWKKNWTPWIVGLSLEYFSRQLSKRDVASQIPGGERIGLTGLEREELKKRGINLAWWGMRGAFYENITKKWIHGFAESLKGKPLLDLVGGVVEDYEYLWGNYYFTTSTL